MPSFILFIYLFIYLFVSRGRSAARCRGVLLFVFVFFWGCVTRGLKSPPISKDIFLRQKIIRVPPGFFKNCNGTHVYPQGFLVKSPCALTCEYPPGTVGHNQIKSSPGVKCSESESSCRVNSHCVSGNRPPGQ